MDEVVEQAPPITSSSLATATHSETNPVPTSSSNQAQSFSSPDWQTACHATSTAFLPPTSYLSLPREPETWLIEPLLPRGGSLLLYGDPKVGKSFAALQLASALAQGADWLGFGVPEQSRVGYLQLDTPRSLWAERVEALTRRTSKTSPSMELSGPMFLADRDSLGLWPFDLLDPSHAAHLRSLLTPLKLDCFILDTLREAHKGDENDSTAMQAVIATLTAVVSPAAMILISHARKPSAEGELNIMNDNRGSNYVVGRMDAIVRMSRSSMRVSGRSIDEQSIPLNRLENGLWELAADPMRERAEVLLRSGQPLRELARLLHQDFPARSEVACRAYLRRKQEQLARASAS